MSRRTPYSKYVVRNHHHPPTMDFKDGGFLTPFLTCQRAKIWHTSNESYIMTIHGKDEPILQVPGQPNQTKPNQIKPNQTKSNQTKPNRPKQYQTKAELNQTNLAISANSTNLANLANFAKLAQLFRIFTNFSQF